MSAPGDELIVPDPLAVGATRPPIVRPFGVPFAYVIPCMVIPLVLVPLTWNPFWLLLIFPLTMLARSVAGRDHNRLRVWRLAYRSGAMFADRRSWQGDSYDPLGSAWRERR